MGDVRLTLACREHSKTLWIEGEYPAGERPDDLFADLAAEGWTVEEFGGPYPGYDEDYNQLGYNVIDFHVTKRGSGLFTSWDEVEQKKFRTKVRAVLRKHGFYNVPVWHKTLVDML
jgi:hypothetical protein